MYDEFEDLETELLFKQLCLEDEEIIEEANINSSDIKAPSKQGKIRYIMITGSGISSHNGRMKVSKHGVRITRNTSHKDYISIYRKNNNTIDYEGNLKDIKMSNSEYQYYVDLFIRNESLIQIIKFGNGKYDSYADRAFIDDENDRLSGLIVRCNEINGDADVYNTEGKLLYRRNIRGEKI